MKDVAPRKSTLEETVCQQDTIYQHRMNEEVESVNRRLLDFDLCNQYTRGAVAMLGSVPSDSFDTLHSYANTFQMPFITPWFPEKVMPMSSSTTDYAISLRPDYHRAVIDTILHYGWTKIIYIYDSHDGK
ncbi:unnamed protein product [Leptosia nina]|uniref:Receptor ligand binding region domain-containing protein n=1 Tax=Leptosia nina TaxID=320188 RepID=A0AAV1K3D4_9NEOP